MHVQTSPSTHSRTLAYFAVLPLFLKTRSSSTTKTDPPARRDQLIDALIGSCG